MNYRKKVFLISLAVTIIIIFIYTPLRTGSKEKDYASSLRLISNKIVMSLAGFEKDKQLAEKNLTKFCSTIREKYSEIAFIAIADTKKLLVEGKNPDFFKSDATLDTIIDSFINDRFSKQEKSDFSIRYYDQNRFYVFIKELHQGKLLVIYPYRLSWKIILQLMLEITLIILASLIISAFVYIQLKKKGKIPSEYPFRAHKIASQKATTGKSKKTDKPEKDTVEKITGIAFDSLNEYILDLFNYISGKYTPDNISLYIADRNNNSLNKIYELKGNAFIKIDGSRYDTIDIKNEIGEELKKSSILIVEKGSKITLPILYRNSLWGIMIIKRNKPFNGAEINDIKTQVERISRPVSEYLLLNDVVIDSETGLYSTTYFKLKLDEQHKLFLKRGELYSVLCISLMDIFNQIEKNKQNIILKTASRLLFREIGEQDIVTIIEGNIYILLPGTSEEKVHSLADKLTNSLTGNKIKLTKDDIAELKPIAGFYTVRENIEITAIMQGALAMLRNLKRQ